MKIHDITLAISAELPVYPGDPPVALESLARISAGGDTNLSRLSISTHCGTHLDAPFHYCDDGLTVDAVPLTLLIGEALVAELPDVMAIGRQQLAGLPLRGVKRLLLKTGNSALLAKGFSRDYAHLTEDGARYLLEREIGLVGIDGLSIERFDGDGSVHRLLLGSGLVILEGLQLAGVVPGHYELICLPLKIKGGDGAPVRAILRAKEHLATAAEFDPHTSRWPLS
jgi:arylformamidase